MGDRRVEAEVQEQEQEQEQEISLLDLLLIAAGEIKLLILGPLVVGLLALGEPAPV